MGRLVLNHSTFLPGLIPLLEKLATAARVQTVTPAVIGQAKGRSPEFRIKVSAPIRGGFKLIARKGKSYQEVFVVTDLDAIALDALLQSLQ